MLTAGLGGQFTRWRRSRKRLSVCSVLRCPDVWWQCSVHGLEKTHHAKNSLSWCASFYFQLAVWMAPNLTTASALFLAEAEGSVVYQSKSQKPASVARSKSLPQKEHDEGEQPTKQYKWDIRWRNVIAFLYLHIFTLYGIYLMFTAAKYQTIIWSK